ncbi:hypothetical protein LTR85_004931 [Meristemomyces frigidus]|nr:hypothetical protein LTR85_004931 [Meristemomyces frigidus]
MLSASIAGRYALYKEGTSRILRWLSRTANLAPTADVTTHGLIDLATAIATAQPPSDIPAAMLELIADVINGRRVCADWYTAQPSATTLAPDSNKSHRHFISVLQDLYDVLKAARKAQKSEAPPIPGPPPTLCSAEVPSRESLTNLFERLHVEEPSDDPLGGPPPKDGTSSRSGRRGLGAVSENALELDEEEEKRFAVWCFLQDMREIRQFVRGVWEEYRDRRLSFYAASTITETAFGIMRRAGSDSEATHPVFGDFDELLRCLDVELKVSLDGQPCMGPYGREAGIDEEPIGAEAVRLFCPSAMAVLHTYDDCFRRFQVRSKSKRAEQHHSGGEEGPSSPESRGSLGPEGGSQEDGATNDVPAKTEGAKAQRHRTGYEKLTAQHSYHPFARVLVTVICEIESLSCDKCYAAETRVFDEFLDGFAQMRKARGIPAWLVSACQSYMDIFALVGSEGHIAVEELRKAVAQTTSAENLHRDYNASGKSKALRSTREKSMKNYLAYDRKLVTEWLSEYKLGEQTTFSMGLPVPGVTPEMWIPAGVYHYLPLTLGERLWKHKLMMHLVGVALINQDLMLLAMAHLYKAAQHFGLLTSVWRDMDWLIEQHTIGGCVRSSPIGQVISPSHARRMAQITPETMAQKQKVIPLGSDFVRALADQATDDDRLGFTRGEIIDVVLRQMHKKATDARERRDGHKGHASSNRPQEVTGLQLLETFKVIVIAHGPGIHFDYVSFWTSSADLLGTMKMVLTSRLPKYLRDFGFESLFVAALLEEPVRLRHRNPLPESSTLRRAANMLQKHIDVHGDKFAKAAFEQSSGHIPLHAPSPLVTPVNDRNHGSECTPEDVLDAENGGHTDGGGTEDGANEAVVADVATTAREAFAARRRRSGRRLLRTRK